jgi:hypothetical protein
LAPELPGDEKKHKPKGTEMTTPLTHNAAPKHHPMMIIAAIAIILFCLAGTAAIMGWIPSSIGGTQANRGDLTEADRAALASQMHAPSPQLAALAPLPASQQLQPVQQPVPAPVQQFQRAPVQATSYAPESNYVPEREAPRAAVRPPVQLAAADKPAKNWCSNCGNVESIR